ncbi:hypothetical protein KKH43_06010 [Patescibacteria group bacterium]|nr:hypothetical protein [Patescibacteria group bacterium]
MTLLDQLEGNKGTVSSALGKSLAKKILAGDKTLLKEAIPLVIYDDKNVRSGAAKIVEKVAEERPEFVSPYLDQLKPALNVDEAQTKWMIIHVSGLCASLEPWNSE